MGLFDSIFNKKPKIGFLARDFDLKGLIRALSYKDLEVRKNAAMAIPDLFQKAPDKVAKTLLDDPHLIDLLVIASKDADETVRFGAVYTMGMWCGYDDRVFGPLVAALDDSDHHVRTSAARGLGFSQKPSSIEPLIAASKKERNSNTLSAILESLDQLGKPQGTAKHKKNHSK